ncbi:aprataxin-like [Tubulanus polymorphus]|uniref:aprataxin-like n=1 Tax=Tubulanus polymorphus TaxID=672921 RepID=UPI003DA374F4
MANENKRKATGNDSRAPAAKKAPGHWSQGLLASMNDPELVVSEDEQIVIIKDKYPKAKYHFLVMPRMSIANLKSLKSEHLKLLKHMHKEAKALIDRTDPEADFQIGYHAIPSMSHVHLHVISKDFDSPCLKTKKHWNSFTTDYFLDSEAVMKMIETDGKVTVDTSTQEKLLKEPLRCHKCRKEMKNMPTLKSHIVTHINK